MATPLPPVDPEVKLPPSVLAQSAASDAIHKQAYQTPDAPQPAAPTAPADGQPVPQPVPPPATPPAQSTPPEPPQPQPPAPAQGDENLTADQWRHRFLSMQGRYNQAAQSIGVLQEQLQELSDENMRMQQHVRTSVPQVPQPQALPSGLTAEEVAAYGPELVDVIQRTARAALMPDLQNTQNSVRQVNQQVQRVTVGGVYQVLDQKIPDWRAINISPRFKSWCGSRDVYSGAVRGELLRSAFQAADAPRVLAFFKGFLDEEQATGQLPDPSLQPQPPAAPRQAAMTLEQLAAPGRAKPATGDNNPGTPADKPIFTRDQIKAFYSAVRQNHYAGREPEKNALEQQIFAAQREGRVR